MIPLRATPSLCLSAAASAGPESIGHPAQACQHLAVVAAEAHHLAEALVEGRVGAVAEGSILDHHHRHGTCDQPGHRTDGAEVVIGPERQGSRSGKGGGLFEVRCPTLEDGGAGDGAAQWAAHPVPANGRPGMQHHAVLEAPDRLARRAHVDQHRLRTEDALQGLGVRPLDEIEGVQRRQQAAQTLVAPGRRRPVHLDHWHALRREVLGEALKPDVDHRERRAQQFVDPHASLVEAISGLLPDRRDTVRSRRPLSIVRVGAAKIAGGIVIHLTRCRQDRPASMEWALSLLPGNGPYRERGSKMDDQNFDVAALFEARIKNVFQATPRPTCRCSRGNRHSRPKILQATSTAICVVRNSLKTGRRGRDGDCSPPPAQIPASGTTAPGSCLGS